MLFTKEVCMTIEENETEKKESKKEKKWYWCRWCRATMMFILVMFEKGKVWKCENCGTER